MSDARPGEQKLFRFSRGDPVVHVMKDGRVSEYLGIGTVKSRSSLCNPGYFVIFKAVGFSGFWKEEELQPALKGS